MLGIIGGSGLYDLEGLTDIRSLDIATPYGAPSAPVTIGTLGDTRVAFLPRHGPGHVLNPSEVPYRANIHALRQLGVTHALSVSAVGSLREDLAPGAMVLPDQLIDRTLGRDRTFFEGGVVAHVSMADPTCAEFRQHLADTCHHLDIPIHLGGTYLCIEGPQFSTRAESKLYRQWGAHIIGMTALPEARLAREAGLCYGIVATVTDYDVWHESADDVSVAAVIAMLHANVGRSRRLVAGLTERPLPACASGCGGATLDAISTAPEHLTDSHRALLALFGSRADRDG